jgi:hypothetical protein
MVSKLSRKIDSSGEDIFFQELKFKKISIHWEPQNIGSLNDAREIFFSSQCDFTRLLIL